MTRRILAGLAFLLLLVAPAAAADLKITDFYGHFQGSASTSEGANNESFLENRGSEVEIQADKNGFSVSWTTLQVKGDETAPGAEASVKTKTLSFKKSGSDGLWLAVDNTATLTPGKAFVWARILENTLIVTTIIVQPNGDYDLTSYDRTLKTKDTMDLRFTRWKNGSMVRRVSAELARVTN
jgi:hypothetical protein